MAVVELRRFNRTWSRHVGLLEESHLGTGRPLALVRLLFEIGREGASVADLRARLGLDSGYLARLLRRLEADGSIVVTASAEDGRRRDVSLTAVGLQELAELDARSDALADELVGGLTAGQQERLADALRTAERLLRAATVTIEEVPIDAPEARAAVGAYLAEIGERFGYVAGPPDTEGRFFVAREDAAVVACGGIRDLPDGRAEIKRLWVDRGQRGSGLGGRMLRHLEAVARAAGHHEVVLDTNGALTEAIAMYDRAGYRRIERYNDNPHAQLFFARTLG